MTLSLTPSVEAALGELRLTLTPAGCLLIRWNGARSVAGYQLREGDAVYFGEDTGDGLMTLHAWRCTALVTGPRETSANPFAPTHAVVGATLERVDYEHA